MNYAKAQIYILSKEKSLVKLNIYYYISMFLLWIKWITLVLLFY